jgi:hypothetical protein
MGNGMGNGMRKPVHSALFDMPSSTTISEIFWCLNSQEDISSDILLLNQHCGWEVDSK